MTDFVIEDASVPPGSYELDFVSYENRVHAEYGDGILWMFEVANGKRQGQQCGRTTGPKAKLGTACATMLAELAGLDPAGGLHVNPDDYIGKRYVGIVKTTPSGKGTRVESIVLKEPEPPRF